MTSIRIRRLYMPEDCEGYLTIDESTSLETVRQECPFFFKTPHGERESYRMYRGFLIVRSTVKFSTGPPERKTVVYGYDVVEQDTRYIGQPKSTRAAKNMIDQIIQAGAYSFNGATTKDPSHGQEASN